MTRYTGTVAMATGSPDGSPFLVWSGLEGERLNYRAQFGTYQEAVDWCLAHADRDAGAEARRIESYVIFEQKAFVSPGIEWVPDEKDKAA